MKAVFGALKSFFRILFLSGKCHAANHNRQRAVALTYYTLFAIVPVAALLFGIAKGFNLDDKLRISLSSRFAHHEEIMENVYHFADTTLKNASGGVVAGVGVIALLWTVFSLAGNIENALNSAWGLSVRRNLLRRFSDYISVMLVTPIVLVIVTSADMVLHQSVQHWLAANPDTGRALTLTIGILARVIPVILTCVVFFLIYFLVPNTKVHFWPALLAAVVAGVFYTLMQDGFVILQRSIFRYNRVYGSFAVLPLFLIWLQWGWQIVLYGAEIGYVAQNLNSGLFDNENSTPASLRLQRIQQLAIAKIIYGNLEQGKGETQWDELEDRLGISAIEIDRGLDHLLDAGVISRTVTDESSSFLPAKAPEQFTVADCLATLDGFGRDQVPGELNKESDKIEEVLTAFASGSKGNALNRPIYDL